MPSPGRRAALLTGAVLLATSLALAGCGSSAARGLASQACQHVKSALRLESQAADAAEASPGRARSLRAAALRQFQAAEPLAAVAAGEDTTWQALQATLEEVGQVAEPLLVPALTAQCASA